MTVELEDQLANLRELEIMLKEAAAAENDMFARSRFESLLQQVRSRIREETSNP